MSPIICTQGCLSNPPQLPYRLGIIPTCTTKRAVVSVSDTLQGTAGTRVDRNGGIKATAFRSNLSGLASALKRVPYHRPWVPRLPTTLAPQVSTKSILETPSRMAPATGPSRLLISWAFSQRRHTEISLIGIKTTSHKNKVGCILLSIPMRSVSSRIRTTSVVRVKVGGGNTLTLCTTRSLIDKDWSSSERVFLHSSSHCHSHCQDRARIPFPVSVMVYHIPAEASLRDEMDCGSAHKGTPSSVESTVSNI